MRFDNCNPIIKPKRYPWEEEIGPMAIMAVYPSSLETIIKSFSHYKRLPQELYDIYLFENKKSRPVAVAGPFLGAPHAVMGLEKLWAIGASTVFVLGCCGSINPDLRIGEVLVPSVALSEEGCSKLYCPGKLAFMPGEVALKHLEGILRRSSLPYKNGGVFSTDAPYRETVEKVLAYRRLGIHGVDMEISALFAVGEFRGIEVAACFVTSDELFELKWKTGFKSKAFMSEIERVSLCVFQNVVESHMEQVSN